MTTPVCIIGAGPAGATASLFLSKYGIAHVLIDRHTFPRDKVCGESFSGRVTHVLRELNPDWEREMLENQVIEKSWQVHFILHPSGTRTTFDFSGNQSPIIKAKRSDFDYWLFEKARQSPLANCLEGFYINTMEHGPEGVTLTDSKNTLTIQAQMVLVCMGENTPVLKKIFPHYLTAGDNQLFIRRYYKQVAGSAEQSNGYEAHFITKPFAHLMLISPIPKGLTMVELGIPKSIAKSKQVHLDDLFHQVLEEIPEFKQRFARAVPLEKWRGVSMTLGQIPRMLSAERVLVAGSSIGSVHPVTGYGVGHAMRSGQLAAYWAAQSLQKGDFSAAFLKQYDREIQKRMATDFRFGKLVHFGLMHFRWMLPVFRLLVFSKHFARVVTNPQFHLNTVNPIFYLRHFFKSVFGKK